MKTKKNIARFLLVISLLSAGIGFAQHVFAQTTVDLDGAATSNSAMLSNGSDLTSGEAFADVFNNLPNLPIVQVTPNSNGSEDYTVTIQLLLIMTALTLIPGMVLGMTAFTRIIVVLAILRQALGLQQTPSNQILLGLAMFLTLFVMKPVFTDIYDSAVVPYTQEEITSSQAVAQAAVPIRNFMMLQTRESDLNLFMRLSGSEPVQSTSDLPFTALIPAFITSELKTAFQIGFLLFIPFLVIDLVVASVLMAMGMVMLSPIIVSLPFKIMLFVLMDGWAMIAASLAASYGY